MAKGDYTKFGGPLAQGVLDLVFAFLGSLYDPSAREKGAALGGSGRETAAPKSPRSPLEVPSKWGQAEKTHPQNDSKFRMVFGWQNAPKSLPQTIPEPPQDFQYLPKPLKALQSLKEQEQIESERKNTRHL